MREQVQLPAHGHTLGENTLNIRAPGHARTAHGGGHGVREQVQLPADGQVVALRRAERHRCYVRRAPHARAREAGANLLQKKEELKHQVLSRGIGLGTRKKLHNVGFKLV